MKEATKNSLRKIIAQVKDISTHLVVERTTEQETTADKSLPSSLLTKQADHFAPHSVEKSKKHHIPSIALALLVVFATLTIFSLFGQSLPALAASAHIAHKASAAQAHDNTPPDIGGEISKKLGSGKPWYCYALAVWVAASAVSAATVLVQGVNVLFSTPEVAGSGGTVFTPGVAQGVANGLILSTAAAAGISGGFTLINNMPECSGKSADQVFFDCSDNSDGTPNISTIRGDWLSGNPNGIDETGPRSGHIARTYAVESYEQQSIMDLSDYARMLGFLLLMPSIILIGYQLMIASAFFRSFRHASAVEGFMRLMLGVLVILVSHEMIKMLIGLENTATDALVALHVKLGYAPIKINGDFSAPYGLSGDDPTSYRGIVMPMSRWGCAANDFIGILGVKLMADLAQSLPFVGGFLGISGRLFTGILFLKAIGEFTLLVMSVSLWAQILMRVVLLNYYIVMAPVAFGCWGLPGGVGQAVVGKWAKGIFSVLSLQVVQLFILTIFPLLLPSDLSGIPLDKLGIFKGLVLELPRILVLMAALKGPKLLQGEHPLTTIGQAGAVAGGTVTAIGAAASHLV